MTRQDIITFWFTTLTPKQWWIKDLELDTQIKTKFQAIHTQAKDNKLTSWRTTTDLTQACTKTSQPLSQTP